MTRNMVVGFGMCALLTATGLAQLPSEFGYVEDVGYIPSLAIDRGGGIHYGPLTVSPEVNASYFHDSNPTYAEHGAKAENGIRVMPVLEMLLKGNGWESYARGWMSKDWILGSSDTAFKDTTAKQYYGESIGFKLETPQKTTLSVSESFDFQNRNDFVSGVGGTNASWQDRYSFALSALVDTRLGEKTGMSVGANYSTLWYDNQFLYGWQDLGGTLGFNRKLTEKSDAVVTFGYDNQWSAGVSGASRCYRATTGISSQPTPKSSYRVEVGAMGYDFNNGENTAASWTYTLAGDWQLSHRLSANVSGSANYQPSETDKNNYTLVRSLSAGLRFDATRRLTTTLDAVYRREDYAKVDVGGDDKRLDNQVCLRGRANYSLFHYTSIFVGADISKNVSTADDCSYNRLFLETGLNLHF